MMSACALLDKKHSDIRGIASHNSLLNAVQNCICLFGNCITLLSHIGFVLSYFFTNINGSKISLLLYLLCLYFVSWWRTLHLSILNFILLCWACFFNIPTCFWILHSRGHSVFYHLTIWYTCPPSFEFQSWTEYFGPAQAGICWPMATKRQTRNSVVNPY